MFRSRSPIGTAGGIDRRGCAFLTTDRWSLDTHTSHCLSLTAVVCSEREAFFLASSHPNRRVFNRPLLPPIFTVEYYRKLCQISIGFPTPLPSTAPLSLPMCAAREGFFFGLVPPNRRVFNRPLLPSIFTVEYYRKLCQISIGFPTSLPSTAPLSLPMCAAREGFFFWPRPTQQAGL